ncbi:hypothetical protein [Dactylosporangium sp. NPDC049140]|uniref:hypothetical protein n=1 Tax=Dactylosporangium sp. NPDC049140 TaxID=3155647 RepID=UPI0033E4B86F
MNSTSAGPEARISNHSQAAERVAWVFYCIAAAGSTIGQIWVGVHRAAAAAAGPLLGDAEAVRVRGAHVPHRVAGSDAEEADQRPHPPHPRA